jgi:ATP-dependent Lon protease
VPFDLSKVMFIATANRLDTIPAPLRDRMEIIEMSYTFLEKEQIARNHLIPKQLKEHGITAEHLELSKDGLDKIISAYAIEPGVRNLERRIAELCACGRRRGRLGQDGEADGRRRAAQRTISGPSATS